MENTKQKEKKPKSNDSNKLPSVPEAVLKRRKRRETAKAHRIQSTIKSKTQYSNKKQNVFKRAEQFVKEHRLKERDEMRLVRKAKKLGNNYILGKSNLAFVIRIRGINQTCPKVKKIIRLFRLKQINSGVFIQLNKATINMLRVIEPYVTWGYPNLKSVRELIFKRGFAKVNGRKMPITSNSIIENALGSENLICTEDLIHEIFTIGPKFKHACNFFWPFKLNTPNSGWRKRTKHYVEGGDFGNREDKINELLERMV